MSSNYVVNEVMNFISTEIPTESAFDITGEYEYFHEFLEDNGITGAWLGVQFVGTEEIPINIGSANTSGKFREIGMFMLHICERSRLGVGSPIRTRGETLQQKFRGMRIGDMIIESVSTPNFESGATLNLDGGYTSATINIHYERDNNL